MDDYETVAEARRETKMYLQAWGVREISFGYQYPKNFEHQSKTTESEITKQNGEEEKWQTPGKLERFLEAIMDENFPNHSKGVKGHMKWNIEDDRCEIHLELKEEMEEVHCEKTYAREDPQVRNIVKLINEEEIEQEELESTFYHFKMMVLDDTVVVNNGEYSNLGLNIQILEGRRTPGPVSQKLISERRDISDETMTEAASAIFQIAMNNASKHRMPPQEGKMVRKVAAETHTNGPILITSKHFPEGGNENIFVHDFIITDGGRKSEYTITNPSEKKGQRGHNREKIKEPSKCAWIIPIVATALPSIPIFAPQICNTCFGEAINITALFTATGIAVAAWIRFLSRRKVWKKAHEKRIRRLAKIPEYPGSELDKKSWFRKARIYAHEYFNYLQTLEERRRNSVMAADEAAKREKEHDHMVLIMRKQEDANAVAFLKEYYARHEAEDQSGL